MTDVAAEAVVFVVEAVRKDIHEWHVGSILFVAFHVLGVLVEDLIASIAELHEGFASGPGVLAAFHGLVGEVSVAICAGSGRWCPRLLA